MPEEGTDRISPGQQREVAKAAPMAVAEAQERGLRGKPRKESVKT
jgi:hypothetical protein